MRPFLLVIDGPTGVGKTTAAKLVHAKIPRTALLGMDRIKWFISGFRRDTRNNRIVNSVVLSMTQTFLEHGISVIVEQGFREGLVDEYQQLGRGVHARVITIVLQAPRPVLLSRIDERNKTPDPFKRPPLARSRILRNIRWGSIKKAPAGAVVIDTTRSSPLTIANTIFRHIKRQ